MAVKRKKRPRDRVQVAKLIGEIATGQTEDSEVDGRIQRPVELGRKGGLKGGKARAEKLTPEGRREIAEQVVQRRRSK